MSSAVGGGLASGAKSARGSLVLSASGSPVTPGPQTPALLGSAAQELGADVSRLLAELTTQRDNRQRSLAAAQLGRQVARAARKLKGVQLRDFHQTVNREVCSLLTSKVGGVGWRRGSGGALRLARRRRVFCARMPCAVLLGLPAGRGHVRALPYSPPCHCRPSTCCCSRCTRHCGPFSLPPP